MLGALAGTKETSFDLQPSWQLNDKGIAPTFVQPAVPAPVPTP